MLKVYWWTGRQNVGDYYGHWLLDKLRVEHTYDNVTPDLAVCGSILQHRNQIPSTTKIWGCGFHNALDKTNVLPYNIYALRGKLSYQKLNLKNEIALGDPGILISKYYNPEVEVSNDIGIVCHYLDTEFLKKEYGNRYKIIDTHTNNVEQFIRELKSCKFIFSSSLHGIIFSHSLGIPAINLETINVGSKNNFKFKDYYSVLDIEYKKIKWYPGIDLEKIAQENYTHCPSKKCILNIQENLLNAFPYKNLLNTKINVCLGAIAKNENNYIREWVEHYKNLNFNKIFLFDNNDLNGETFDSVIKDYIDDGFVEILNVRGKSNMQIYAFNELYKCDKIKDFDWIAYFDIDEFLFLDNCKSIQEFLNQDKYTKFNCIAINWKYFDDNNLTQVTNSFAVKERFTHEFNQPHDMRFAEHTFSKRIMKTKVPNLVINSSHGPINRISHSETTYNGTSSNPTVICCNVEGKRLQRNYLCFSDWTYNGAHIKHYRFKTIEEYITNKMKRGYPTLYKNSGKDLELNDFFKLNKVTLSKLKIASSLLNIPLDDLTKEFEISKDIEEKPQLNIQPKTAKNEAYSNKKLKECSLPTLDNWI